MLKKQRAFLPVSVLAVITFVAGCVNMHSGKDFDATKAQNFQKGKTSRADIVAEMGEPLTTGNSPEGRFIEYQYQTINGNTWSTLLSTYGIGAGSVDEEQKVCRFILDKEDKLKDYTCAKGAPNYSNFGKQ